MLALAIQALQEEAFEKALTLFNRFLDDNPDHLEGLYHRAITFRKLKNYGRSLDDLDKIIRLAPDFADFYCERGITYFHMQEFQTAIPDMNKALDLEPENPYRYSSRAYIRARLGDTKGAIEDYQQAIALDPEDAVARNNLGMLEERLGNLKKARDYYKIADELDKMQLTEKSAKPNGYHRRENKAIRENNLPEQKNLLQQYLGIIIEVFTSRQAFRQFIQFNKSLFEKR